ncbi:MAG: hypothetical protein JW891_06260 [Candidatus Lokiarchaeota archaeon]|nr:hypothetical protein [Candidatus Lokiarchaeota archaeon]
MTRNDSDIIIIKDKKSSFKGAYWVLFALLLFVAIYVPFFGTNLRYQTSAVLKTVFNTIGTICLVGGGILIAFGIISIFLKGTRGLAMMLIGVLALWIGSWLTGTPFLFELFGLGADASESTGYH